MIFIRRRVGVLKTFLTSLLHSFSLCLDPHRSRDTTGAIKSHVHKWAEVCCEGVMVALCDCT